MKKGNKKDVFFPDGLQDNIKKIDSWDWNIHKGQRSIVCCIQNNVCYTIQTIQRMYIAYAASKCEIMFSTFIKQTKLQTEKFLDMLSMKLLL